VVIGESPRTDFYVSANIYSTQSHVVGSVVFTDEAQLTDVLHAADGRVDVLLLDVDRKRFGPANSAETARAALKKTALLTYLDSRVWVEAVEDQMVRILNDTLTQSDIVVAGDHPRSRSLALRIAERGARVTLVQEPHSAEDTAIDSLRTLSREGSELHLAQVRADVAGSVLTEANAVIVWPAGTPWFDGSFSALVSPDAYLFDASIGAILPDGVAEAQRRGCRLLRVNIWPTLTSVLAAAHESLLKMKDALGWGTLDGVSVVAGGAMGVSGDVIVDSIHHPTRVIGVCDGCGGVRFRFDEAEAERVRRVQTEINRRLVSPQMAGAVS
jgi:hypothetical protein